MTDYLRKYAHWSEYDLVLLPGTWRRTYDPRRHTYVMNYCQPIGFQPVTPDNIDKAMDFEIEPEVKRTGLDAARALFDQQEERKLQWLIDLLRERGPMTPAEVAQESGYRPDWLATMAKRYPDRIQRVYRIKRLNYYGLVGETYALPGMAVPVGGTGKRK